METPNGLTSSQRSKINIGWSKRQQSERFQTMPSKLPQKETKRGVKERGVKRTPRYALIVERDTTLLTRVDGKEEQTRGTATHAADMDITQKIMTTGSPIRQDEA